MPGTLLLFGKYREQVNRLNALHDKKKVLLKKHWHFKKTSETGKYQVGIPSNLYSIDPNNNQLIDILLFAIGEDWCVIDTTGTVDSKEASQDDISFFSGFNYELLSESKISRLNIADTEKKAYALGRSSARSFIYLAKLKKSGWQNSPHIEWDAEHLDPRG